MLDQLQLIPRWILHGCERTTPELALGFSGEDHAFGHKIPMRCVYVLYRERQSSEATHEHLLLMRRLRSDRLDYQLAASRTEDTEARLSATRLEWQPKRSFIEALGCRKVANEDASCTQVHLWLQGT
jgi:hypothetical protein